ncbi:MAG: anti-sigma regulatory factor [Deltaproteobacteria bacterium]|nr:MAG: anti-sigma regulatory factor [Deltaproteobacteria bacterium]
MQIIPIQEEYDVVKARQAARNLAGELGFSMINKTRVATAVSELARNTLVHGLGGTMRLESVTKGSRWGILCVFEDKGPGIADIPAAMGEGFSTSGTLGQGLPGARRLMDEMDIQSEEGVGTCIEVIKWS